MQWVLGKHANWGTKSIKTVKLAPLKGDGEWELLQTLLIFAGVLFLFVYIFAELGEI